MISLALRYLLSRRRQTMLMLLGIFFGSSAFVLLSGFMLGFRGYILDQLINNNAHVHVQAREEFLTPHGLDGAFYGGVISHLFWDPPPSGRKDSAMVENPQSWYRRLDSDPRVAAWTPQLSIPAIFARGKAVVSTTLIGCDPARQVKVTTIADYVVEGKFSDIAVGGGGLVIGEELKKKLGAAVSQNVLVSSGKGAPVPFKVAAVFRTGSRMVDTLAYAAIGDVQKVNGTPSLVGEIAVRLTDHMLAARVASAWSRLAPEKVESWDQQNANIFNVFKMQDTVRFASIGAIMIVAGFGIYNVLSMTVMQKRRDIAILRSMGFDARDILMLFFSQGLILGVAGTALGLLFGWAFSFYLETIPFAGPMGPGAGHLLISRAPEIYAQAAVLSLFSSCLAGILPARTAGKMNPIEIIREGAE